MELGKQIKKYRQESQLSQEELGAIVSYVLGILLQSL